MPIASPAPENTKDPSIEETDSDVISTHVPSNQLPANYGLRLGTHDIPAWIETQRLSWGRTLRLPEWDDANYRANEGWHGKDLVHSLEAPVHIMEYLLKYDRPTGGIGTTLTGTVHFNAQTESHKGVCHGGSICSVLDDAIGHTAFCVTGEYRRWSGYTVKVNASLKKAVRVESVLKVVCYVVKVERRKVWLECELITVEDATENVVASGEGLVVLNRGVPLVHLMV